MAALGVLVRLALSITWALFATSWTMVPSGAPIELLGASFSIAAMVLASSFSRVAQTIVVAQVFGLAVIACVWAIAEAAKWSIPRPAPEVTLLVLVVCLVTLAFSFPKAERASLRATAAFAFLNTTMMSFVLATSFRTRWELIAYAFISALFLGTRVRPEQATIAEVSP